jgi:hypothetical protein
MSWDDNYGCLVCAQSPFNIMLAFLSPFLVMSQVNEKLFYITNEAICIFLYLPFLSVLLTAFNVCNLIFLPISYLIFSARLLTSIFDQDTTKASVKRFSFFILYIIVGPIFLSITYLIDMIVFFANLFTKPLVDEYKTHKQRVFKS